MIKGIYQIKTPSSKFFLLPSKSSSLETECLFGEYVQVNEIFKRWALCTLLTDGYVGWTERKNLSKKHKQTHRIIVPRTFILNKKNIKDKSFGYLPLGSSVNVLGIDKVWAKIDLQCLTKGKFGFVPKSHITLSEHKVKDWVNVAESLIYTPYKWGGRDSIGIDCSALVQLSLQTSKINIPRNTSDQVKYKNFHPIKIDNLTRGCLVFWKGHVAITLSKTKIIHANAFHMMVEIELLSSAIERIGKPTSVLFVNSNP